MGSIQETVWTDGVWPGGWDSLFTMDGTLGRISGRNGVFFTTGNRGMAVCFAGALGGFFTLMILPAHLIEPCVELSVFLRGVYSVFSIYREGGKAP